MKRVLLLFFGAVLAELVCKCTDTNQTCITNAECNPTIGCVCRNEELPFADIQLQSSENQEIQVISSSDTDSNLLLGAGIGFAAGAVLIIAFVGWMVYDRTKRH